MHQNARRTTRHLALAAAVAAGLAGTVPAAQAEPRSPAAPVTVATGLVAPRHLSFSPNGQLFVAEAGVDGSGACLPNPEDPTGPAVCLGMTGSVARVDANQGLTRVLTGLPSIGGAGPSDIEFTGNHQFAVVIGLGASPAARATLGRNGALLGHVVTGDLRTGNHVTPAFDVSAYEAANNPDGTDIDSNPVSLDRWGNGYVVADAGANDVVDTRKGGSALAVLPPIPSSLGFPADAVPTSAVQGPDGAWYISQLTGYPFDRGASAIWRVVPGQAPTVWATGLTQVTDLAFSGSGRLYAVQISETSLADQSLPPIGSLVRVAPGSTSPQQVVGGLFAPYGVAIRGTDAYVTTGSVAPGGTVVKVHIS